MTESVWCVWFWVDGSWWLYGRPHRDERPAKEAEESVGMVYGPEKVKMLMHEIEAPEIPHA